MTSSTRPIAQSPASTFCSWTFSDLAAGVAERGTRDLLLALGIGSLFNHSDQPNVDYRVAPPFTGEDANADPQGRVVYRCSRPIAPGEELCIYYGPDLWFKENQAVE